MESKNYYDILEVSVKASAQEIALAKNKLAKRYHPDVNMRNGIDTTDKMQERPRSSYIRYLLESSRCLI